jgi:hypothetical protein
MSAIPIGWYRVVSVCDAPTILYRLGHLLDVRPDTPVTSDRGRRRWPTLTRNGQIYVWYGPAAPGPPPPAIAHPIRRAKSQLVAAHVSLIGENICDTTHFPVVHHRSIQTSEMTARISIGGALVVHQALRVYALGIPHTITSTLFSPGNVVVEARFLGLVQVLHGMLTPIDEHHTESHVVVSSPYYLGLGWPLSRFFLHRATSEIAHDVPIWEHLSFRERPLLVEGDGPIATFRKWYRGYLPDAVPAVRSSPSIALTDVLSGG